MGTAVQGHEKNLETLQRAFDNGDAGLAEVRERATGKTRVALCTIHTIDNGYQITPFALMIDGNPYEQLNPPHPDGEFFKPEET
jgi:hypothetical protein